jgi:hypothetical protein
MEKVVGSSPISRSIESPAQVRACVVTECHARGYGNARRALSGRVSVRGVSVDPAAAEPVRQPLRCSECGAVADEHARGWRAYMADIDELAVFFPACAVHEFGDEPE